jgi:CheY-like chemotaxis protein
LRVKQIFNHLLSSAFRHTESGSVEWTLSCKREGNSLWLTGIVKDTGSGIHPEYKETIFGEHSQGDLKRNYGIQGSGLGLSITKMLVERMDGSIALESEYGAGAVFTVKLRQQSVGEERIDSEALKSLREFRYRSKVHARDFERERVQDTRVLVVDDIEINLEIASGVLEAFGINADCVSSGQKAVDIIRAGEPRYSAIFMDHMMPGMDGIEAAQAIRNKIGSDYAKNIPIIALTANAVAGNEKMFLQNGFQAFISKPIDMKKLNEIINVWIRKKTDDADQSASAEEEEDSESFGDIDGIDTAAALQNIGGDIDTYIKILKSFNEHTPSLLEKLNPEKLTDYAIAVHGIKGAAYSIGAYTAGKRAEELEAAAKGGDADFVSLRAPAFIKIMRSLLENINSFLVKHSSENVLPFKSAPEPEVLAQILEACRQYDISKIETLIDGLEKFQYESEGELVAWLRRQANISDFEQIEEKLSARGL